ncbi:MYB-1 [Magnaporthiopsis poae ATCC 64411]|uniref:MYB-1 n=1 Tax=Magnaporthiopsis poae (strain ATCC 64411 / 73-15) TaxID=644358 RepID=A0A0C4DVB9_MAGP6|nr:MYB-1 [Magnaporthiopsis poae ATCC 64411]
MRAYDFHHARATHPASSFLFHQGPVEADDSVADMTNSHKRGPWSQAEDHQLMTLVTHQGALNWVRIAQYLGTRTPKQCRERYHQNLKPSLNHEPISPEEGAQIERMVHEMGKRWAEIARRLHNRSDNAVKNWWNGSQNRRKRDGRRKSSYGGHHHITAGNHPNHIASSQQHYLPSPADSAAGHHHLHQHEHQQQHQHQHQHQYQHQYLLQDDAHAAAAGPHPNHAHTTFDRSESSYSRVGPLELRSLADIPRILPPPPRPSLQAPPTYQSHLPTAPNSPVNSLPALRMSPQQQQQQQQQPQQQHHHHVQHRPSASRDRLVISSLIS